jgi:hypothetical protein
MPGVMPSIHVYSSQLKPDVDGHDTWREDALRAFLGHDGDTSVRRADSKSVEFAGKQS